MSFRDFINNRRFRRSIKQYQIDYANIQPPANPTPKYIRKLISRLLDCDESTFALRELSMMSDKIVPYVVEAIADPKYRIFDWEPYSSSPTPFDSLISLLVPSGSEDLLKIASAMANNPEEEIRKCIAIHLATLGSSETIPLLKKLLNDPDGYVRSYVCIGVDRAIAANHASEDFRREMYLAILEQCDQEWPGSMNDAASHLIRLNAKQASIDLASEQFLTTSNPELSSLLSACNLNEITLPAKQLLKIHEESLPRLVGERCYPNDYIVGGVLIALARSIGEKSRPLLESAMSSPYEEIVEAVGKGLAMIASVIDPVRYVLDQFERVGFDGLTLPQKHLYCAFLFDSEVCNGGLMQFIANHCGKYIFPTRDAIIAINHPQALACINGVIKELGSLAQEPEQDKRLSAVEGQYDQLKSIFDKLESDYYKNNSLFRQKMMHIAVENASDFKD